MKAIENESLALFDDGKAFPPGFRFHPTDEELVLYHLKGKMCHRRFKFDVIAETDVYKWDPEEFAGLSKLKTGDRQWFFFTPRDTKYPNGARSNRTTRHGYWKLTGKDRIILCNSRSVGVKKTLVYYIGRSPNGERTDWVMHEYTLTEEEVKRCPSIKDYYALYKVFKKSGVGPKNGEQYGAPFREEDWEDNNVKEVEVNTEFQTLVDDFDEFMNKIANDSVHVQSFGVEHNGGYYSLGDLVGEEEAESHLSVQTQPAWLNNNDEASFDISQSNILEDVEEFIEMDDLFVPDKLENEFIDGLEEFDLYNLLNCLGDGEVGDQDNNNISNLNNGVLNSNNYNFEHLQANFQQPYLLDEADDMNFPTFSQNQSCNVYNPGDSLVTPGVINESNYSNDETGEISSWEQEDNGKDSRISSLLWSFVESIPTTPASAAQNDLIVNRALFERMSSFSKLRRRRIINYSSSTSVVDDVAASSSGSNSAKNNKSVLLLLLLCFSVFGILCAVLWMMIDTST